METELGDWQGLLQRRSGAGRKETQGRGYREGQSQRDFGGNLRSCRWTWIHSVAAGVSGWVARVKRSLLDLGLCRTVLAWRCCCHLLLDSFGVKPPVASLSVLVFYEQESGGKGSDPGKSPGTKNLPETLLLVSERH